MGGFSTWPMRDIFIIAALVFNAGGLVYLLTNHMRHVQKSLDRIEEGMIVITEDVSSIKTDVAVVQEKIRNLK